MKSFPVSFRRSDPVEMKIGSIVPAIGENGPELVRIKKIVSIDYDGHYLKVVSMAEKVEETGEAGD